MNLYDINEYLYNNPTGDLKMLIGAEVWYDEDFNDDQYKEFDIFVSNLMTTKMQDPELAVISQIRGGKLGINCDLHNPEHRETLKIFTNRISKIVYATRTSFYIVKSFNELMDLYINHLLTVNGKLYLIADLYFNRYQNTPSFLQIQEIDNEKSRFIITTEKDVPYNVTSDEKLYEYQFKQIVPATRMGGSYDLELTKGNGKNKITYYDSVYDKFMHIYGDKIKVKAYAPDSVEYSIYRLEMSKPNTYPLNPNKGFVPDWKLLNYYTIERLY